MYLTRCFSAVAELLVSSFVHPAPVYCCHLLNNDVFAIGGQLDGLLLLWQTSLVILHFRGDDVYVMEKSTSLSVLVCLICVFTARCTMCIARY